MSRRLLATVALTMMLLTFTLQFPTIVVQDGPGIIESGTYTGSLTYDSFPIDKMGCHYGDGDYYGIQLGWLDMVSLTLDVPHDCDFDLGAWCEVPGHTHPAGSENPEISGPWGLGSDEELSFGVLDLYAGHEGVYLIFVGAFSGSGSYTLTVEIERVKEITESGTVTGSLSPGTELDWLDCYKVQLQEGDFARFTLDPSSTLGAELEVYCREHIPAERVPGHEDHWWYESRGVGQTGTVEITGGSVPHDGTYYIVCRQWSGRGIYTLTSVIDRTPPSITGVSYSPQRPQPEDTVTVTATVTDADSGVKTVTLLYSTDGGAWSSVTMTPTTGSTYSATIPKLVDGTAVQLKVSAEDNAEFTAESAVQSYTVKALIFGLEPIVFYGLIGGIVIAIVLLLVFLLMHRRVPPVPPTPPAAPPYAPPPPP